MWEMTRMYSTFWVNGSTFVQQKFELIGRLNYNAGCPKTRCVYNFNEISQVPYCQEWPREIIILHECNCLADLKVIQFV